MSVRQSSPGLRRWPHQWDGRVAALEAPDVHKGDQVTLESILFDQSRSELLPPGKTELDSGLDASPKIGV